MNDSSCRENENSCQNHAEPKAETKTAENSSVSEVIEPCPILPQYEFDAPRYKNFCLKKWRPIRRLLNKIVLKIEEPENEEEETETEAETEDSNDGVTEEFSFLMNFEDAEQLFNKTVDDGETDYEELDAWFNRFHPLHEPLRPQTPPGPLLSPERTNLHRPLRGTWATPPRHAPSSPLKQSPSLSSSTKASPTKTNPLSSPIKSHKNSLLASPIKTKLLSSPVRTFSPLTRISSLTSSPTRSPLTAAPVAPVKIGLRAKAARVLKPEDGESKETGNDSLVKKTESESKAEVNNAVISTETQAKSTSSALKREHAEAASFDNHHQPLKRARSKKGSSSSQVDLDDIKKLLNQHNNRIRPHSNKR